MKENPMRKIKIEKVTLNVGVGESGEKLEKAKKLIEKLIGEGRKAVITNSKKKIPAFKIRPGLPIGVKATIRDDPEPLLKRLFEAVENNVKAKSFNGRNLSFGIDEYIHIPGTAYDPSIGIIGLEVTITLIRPGYHVQKRRLNKSSVGKKHVITNDEAREFLTKKFGVKVV